MMSIIEACLLMMIVILFVKVVSKRGDASA